MPLLGAASQAPITAHLKAVPRTVPKPKAIITVSAHWEADKVTVSTAERPGMLYDYYGFPPESYTLQYPAPGHPALARRALELLRARGIPCAADDKRGYDHGTFVPLMLSYPDADIPVVQMSVIRSLDPKAHLEVGEALAPLRDEGVLIYASGLSFHNMKVFKSNGFESTNTTQYQPSQAFDDYLHQACVGSKDRDTRWRLLSEWAKAPGGKESHPREEHLIPLMVAAGAAGDDPGRVSFSDWVMGAKTSGFVFGA